MDTELQPLPSRALTPEQRELERQTFAIAFESALEQVAEGVSLSDFCREYHTPLARARFLAWILRDEKREQFYNAALAVGARAMEDDLVRLADGKNPDGSESLSDVSRSNLQINTRIKVMQFRDRKRYGEIKQIEQTSTTKIETSSMSTAELRERLLETLNIKGGASDIFEEAHVIEGD